MHPEIDPADVELLRAQGMNEEDLAHSVAVAEKALEIAARVASGGTALDRVLVARGALFHDLGKTITHAIEHGRLGAELGARLGLPPEVLAVMEKHIRGGLTPEEAREFGLPVKDYTLHGLEERVIIYADRLVDILTEDLVPLRDPLDAEERFEDILEAYPKYGKNEATMARYKGYHREIQGLMRAD
ncbi:Ribonuclease Y [Fundidesulfovibrio magnetotacticus]|uniref:Ribonuclease Y n=1 Tax=Fundidesulfovibrio magnetotacticus TaxID=2730080 RepID=A0A6V8LU01_9BACT|nr:HDIG domain-containing metalloprotein [Fundidesulfovibrio magnetotacticus]GFK95893.1 Ribonuclease Y [Fundidesulfovibrio magnetotacticus]